jgi:broad specificity phosphatase PhoE
MYSFVYYYFIHMHLTFIRHGETTDNLLSQISDQKHDMLVELTEQGFSRARDLGVMLENETFDAVFVSDMVRTQQTAEEIFHKKFPVVLEKRLREAVVSTTPGTICKYDDMSQSEWIV